MVGDRLGSLLCPHFRVVQEAFENEQAYTAKMLHLIHNDSVDEHYKVRMLGAVPSAQQEG